MSIPVQYFQVTATAIPTLLIAVVVGIKAGNEIMQSFSQKKKLMATALVFVVGFTLMVGAGELSALIALVQGEGNSFEAFCSFVAIIGCLIAIASEFFAPLMTRFPRHISQIAFGVVGLGAAGGACWWFFTAI